MAVALVVVRVSCLIVAPFVVDADIVVVGESKRGEVDMDDEFDDDGVGNDD